MDRSAPQLRSALDLALEEKRQLAEQLGVARAALAEAARDAGQVSDGQVSDGQEYSGMANQASTWSTTTCSLPADSARAPRPRQECGPARARSASPAGRGAGRPMSIATALVDRRAELRDTFGALVPLWPTVLLCTLSCPTVFYAALCAALRRPGRRIDFWQPKTLKP
eukprot:1515-Prorocentrum_minimum.AAC.4